jgi:site-specific DNA-cytosine methylase
MEAILFARPSRIGFENVEGFLGSQAHQTLRETLDQAGYIIDEKILCPSMFGLPNRRPRYLLAAVLDFQPTLVIPTNPERRYLTEFLREPEEVLFLSDAIVQKYGPSFHTVYQDDPDAMTAVFTSAYTKSWMYAGSFLRQSDGRLRAFSPREILNLLGFPESFSLPNLGRRQAYKYVGNSLSIPTTRSVIDALLQNY